MDIVKLLKDAIYGASSPYWSIEYSNISDAVTYVEKQKPSEGADGTENSAEKNEADNAITVEEALEQNIQLTQFDGFTRLPEEIERCLDNIEYSSNAIGYDELSITFSGLDLPDMKKPIFAVGGAVRLGLGWHPESIVKEAVMALGFPQGLPPYNTVFVGVTFTREIEYEEDGITVTLYCRELAAQVMQDLTLAQIANTGVLKITPPKEYVGLSYVDKIRLINYYEKQEGNDKGSCLLRQLLTNGSKDSAYIKYVESFRPLAEEDTGATVPNDIQNITGVLFGSGIPYLAQYCTVKIKCIREGYFFRLKAIEVGSEVVWSIYPVTPDEYPVFEVTVTDLLSGKYGKKKSYTFYSEYRDIEEVGDIGSFEVPDPIVSFPVFNTNVYKSSDAVTGTLHVEVRMRIRFINAFSEYDTYLEWNRHSSLIQLDEGDLVIGAIYTYFNTQTDFSPIEFTTEPLYTLQEKDAYIKSVLTEFKEEQLPVINDESGRNRIGCSNIRITDGVLEKQISPKERVYSLRSFVSRIAKAFRLVPLLDFGFNQQTDAAKEAERRFNSIRVKVMEKIPSTEIVAGSATTPTYFIEEGSTNTIIFKADVSAYNALQALFEKETYRRNFRVTKSRLIVSRADLSEGDNVSEVFVYRDIEHSGFLGSLRDSLNVTDLTHFPFSVFKSFSIDVPTVTHLPSHLTIPVVYGRSPTIASLSMKEEIDPIAYGADPGEGAEKFLGDYTDSHLVSFDSMGKDEYVALRARVGISKSVAEKEWDDAVDAGKGLEEGTKSPFLYNIKTQALIDAQGDNASSDADPLETVITKDTGQAEKKLIEETRRSLRARDVASSLVQNYDYISATMSEQNLLMNRVFDPTDSSREALEAQLAILALGALENIITCEISGALGKWYFIAGMHFQLDGVIEDHAKYIFRATQVTHRIDSDGYTMDIKGAARYDSISIEDADERLRKIRLEKIENQVDKFALRFLDPKDITATYRSVTFRVVNSQNSVLNNIVAKILFTSGTNLQYQRVNGEGQRSTISTGTHEQEMVFTGQKTLTLSKSTQIAGYYQFPDVSTEQIGFSRGSGIEDLVIDLVYPFAEDPSAGGTYENLMLLNEVYISGKPDESCTVPVNVVAYRAYSTGNRFLENDPKGEGPYRADYSRPFNMFWFPENFVAGESDPPTPISITLDDTGKVSDTSAISEYVDGHPFLYCPNGHTEDDPVLTDDNTVVFFLRVKEGDTTEYLFPTKYGTEDKEIPIDTPIDIYPAYSRIVYHKDWTFASEDADRQVSLIQNAIFNTDIANFQGGIGKDALNGGVSSVTINVINKENMTVTETVIYKNKIQSKKEPERIRVGFPFDMFTSYEEYKNRNTNGRSRNIYSLNTTGQFVQGYNSEAITNRLNLKGAALDYLRIKEPTDPNRDTITVKASSLIIEGRTSDYLGTSFNRLSSVQSSGFGIVKHNFGVREAQFAIKYYQQNLGDDTDEASSGELDPEKAVSVYLVNITDQNNHTLPVKNSEEGDTPSVKLYILTANPDRSFTEGTAIEFESNDFPVRISEARIAGLKIVAQEALLKANRGLSAIEMNFTCAGFAEESINAIIANTDIAPQKVTFKSFGTKTKTLAIAPYIWRVGTITEEFTAVDDVFTSTGLTQKYLLKVYSIPDNSETVQTKNLLEHSVAYSTTEGALFSPLATGNKIALPPIKMRIRLSGYELPVFLKRNTEGPTIEIPDTNDNTTYVRVYFSVGEEVSQGIGVGDEVRIEVGGYSLTAEVTKYKVDKDGNDTASVTYNITNDGDGYFDIPIENSNPMKTYIEGNKDVKTDIGQVYLVSQVAYSDQYVSSLGGSPTTVEHNGNRDLLIQTAKVPTDIKNYFRYNAGAQYIVKAYGGFNKYEIEAEIEGAGEVNTLSGVRMPIAISTGTIGSSDLANVPVYFRGNGFPIIAGKLQLMIKGTAASLVGNTISSARVEDYVDVTDLFAQKEGANSITIRVYTLPWDKHAEDVGNDGKLEESAFTQLLTIQRVKSTTTELNDTADAWLDVESFSIAFNLNKIAKLVKDAGDNLAKRILEGFPAIKIVTVGAFTKTFDRGLQILIPSGTAFIAELKNCGHISAMRNLNEEARLNNIVREKQNERITKNEKGISLNTKGIGKNALNISANKRAIQRLGARRSSGGPQVRLVKGSDNSSFDDFLNNCEDIEFRMLLSLQFFSYTEGAYETIHETSDSIFTHGFMIVSLTNGSASLTIPSKVQDKEGLIGVRLQFTHYTWNCVYQTSDAAITVNDNKNNDLNSAGKILYAQPLKTAKSGITLKYSGLSNLALPFINSDTDVKAAMDLIMSQVLSACASGNINYKW